METFWRQVRVVVKYPAVRERAPERSGINLRLDSILQCIHAGDVAGAQEAVETVRSVLQLSSGKQQRAGKKGGVQYKPLYILDSVLLADNLKLIHADEPDLLETVVKQQPVSADGNGFHD